MTDVFHHSVANTGESAIAAHSGAATAACRAQGHADACVPLAVTWVSWQRSCCHDVQELRQSRVGLRRASLLHMHRGVRVLVCHRVTGSVHERLYMC
jgi:hypothetical protein